MTPAAAEARSGRGAPAPGPAYTATVETPAHATLTAAAGAFGGGAWDVSGQKPLKALLQADPTLGLSDFQMKTFLGAAGATPAKAGGAALAANSAWSPLAASQPSEAAAAAKAAARAAGGPHGASERPSHGAPPALVAGIAGDGAASSNPTNGAGPRRGQGDAATVAAVDASADGKATATLSVALANLPAFIADQVDTLSSVGAFDAQSAAAPVESPKAAQAVKELNISLEPADLGQMTLKLRLAGGKLSVTIAVANPRTLSSIEDDRALIAARLSAGDRTLENSHHPAPDPFDHGDRAPPWPRQRQRLRAVNFGQLRQCKPRRAAAARLASRRRWRWRRYQRSCGLNRPRPALALSANARWPLRRAITAFRSISSIPSA